jgi:hypothetical protein
MVAFTSRCHLQSAASESDVHQSMSFEAPPSPGGLPNERALTWKTFAVLEAAAVVGAVATVSSSPAIAPCAGVMWTASILAALLFGLGHLPPPRAAYR